MKHRDNLKNKFLELIWWLFAIPIYGCAAYPSIFLLKLLSYQSLWLFCLGIFPALFLFIAWLLIMLGIIFTFIPEIKEGTYSLDRRGTVITWMLSAGLHNYVRLIGIQRLIYSNPFLRRIYFKAFRAKVHPSAIIAYDAVLVDPFLLEIGRNAKIGDLAKISGHFSDTKRFVFKRVIIEQRAIIGGNSSIGAGVTLKEGSMLCAESVVAPDTVIPQNEVWFGRPAKRILSS